EPLRRRPSVRPPPSQPPSAPPRPGLIPQPPGNAYDPKWYAPREKEAQHARPNLENDGAPATAAWGPPPSGTTWFPKPTVRRLMEEDSKVKAVEINLNTFREDQLGGYDRFLHEVVVRVAREAGNPAWAAEVWTDLPDDPGQALGLLLYRHVLPAAPRVLLV